MSMGSAPFPDHVDFHVIDKSLLYGFCRKKKKKKKDFSTFEYITRRFIIISMKNNKMDR